MGIQTQFDKFHKKIMLGREDTAYKKARDRDDSITADLKNAFRDAGYPITQTFIQGSLATHTAVLPLSGDYDIDRALVIADDTAPDNPIDPKLKTLNVLEGRGFKNAKIKKPCVTADYATEAVHIDFPIYKFTGSQHYLAVGKRNSDEENRAWSGSDPRGLIAWVNDKSGYFGLSAEKLTQYRRIVRYLKRWRDNRFSESVAKKVHSIGLTIMAKEQFQPSFTAEGTRQDLIALRDTVNLIYNGSYFLYQGRKDQYRVSVALPVQPWRDVFDGSSVDTGTQLRNKMAFFLKKLNEAASLDDAVKQAEILKELFGDDFEVPDSQNNGSDKQTKARYASSGVVGTSQGA